MCFTEYFQFSSCCLLFSPWGTFFFVLSPEVGELCCFTEFSILPAFSVDLLFRVLNFAPVLLYRSFVSYFQDDQKMAARLANTMCNSLKGRPVLVSLSLLLLHYCSFYFCGYPCLKVFLVQGRIFQGKEPPQFVAIFQPMVVLKVIL